MAKDNIVKEITSEYKGARISPRKMALVANFARKKKVDGLIKYLPFEPKKGAGYLLQSIKSASANAKNLYNINESDLYVKDILIGQGPTAKRRMFGARGRMKRILKRTAHIKVVLAPLNQIKGEPKNPEDKVEKSQQRIVRERTRHSQSQNKSNSKKGAI